MKSGIFEKKKLKLWFHESMVVNSNLVLRLNL